MSIAAVPTPTSSAAAPARPAASARDSTASPPPTSPTTASASTSTLSKRHPRADAGIGKADALHLEPLSAPLDGEDGEALVGPARRPG